MTRRPDPWHREVVTDPSHVFVLHGDTTHLACDAWLLPTDECLNVTETWTRGDRDLRARIDALRAEGRMPDPALAVPAWCTDAPLPVLTAVPFRGTRDPAELASRAGAALHEAHSALASRKPLHERERPLFALGAFGTGGGGAGGNRGAVVWELLRVLQPTADELGMDLALVLRQRGDYLAAQAARRQHPTAGTWAGLSDGLRIQAEALGMQARTGGVIPFLGAGVSVGAGLPGWTGLITELLETVAITAADRERLAVLDILDQAHVVAALMTDPSTLGRRVAEVVSRVRRHSMNHALLASLPGREAVTLNYDQLYEQAVRDTGSTLAVLPERAALAADRWLLKLHGTVETPASIVLTRQGLPALQPRTGDAVGGGPDDAHHPAPVVCRVRYE